MVASPIREGGIPRHLKLTCEYDMQAVEPSCIAAKRSSVDGTHVKNIERTGTIGQWKGWHATMR